MGERKRERNAGNIESKHERKHEKENVADDAMERVTVAGDKPVGDGKADVKELRSRKTPHPVEDQISHGGHSPKRQLHRELEKKKG